MARTSNFKNVSEYGLYQRFPDWVGSVTSFHKFARTNIFHDQTYNEQDLFQRETPHDIRSTDEKVDQMKTWQ